MLEGLKPPVKVWPCKVRSISTELSASDAKILLDAAENIEWKIYALQKALGERGISLSEKALHKHRNKICSCYRL